VGGSLDRLKHQAEIDAYYLSDSAQPRAAGVMWPALVERRVDSLFEAALRPDKKVHEELFHPSAALGNYGTKVKLAYMLGWIHEDIYKDLLSLSKIRNRFAHVIEAKDFSDQKISDFLRNMKVYKFIPGMLEDAKKRASLDPSAINLAMVSATTRMVENPQSGFRFCIDLMIDHLEKCKENMEKNLSSLPGDWLISETLPTENRAKYEKKS
jgi:DNA-binding MltR family transcriptional regulator